MDLLNRITIQTPESVELEFTLAGLGNRALALLIDYTVLGISLALLLMIWSLIATHLADIIVQVTGNADRAEQWLFALTLLTSFAIYVGYFVFFETLWRGQSPGKRYLKLRVINIDGRPGGLAQATLRALLRPIDDIIFIGMWLILFTRQERRLGDLVAGTLVVQEALTVAAATFPVEAGAAALAQNLEQLANIARLTPDDFAVVRDYLQRRKAMEDKARNQISLDLARQTKEAIALDTVPADTTSDLFLEAVYLAYQQLNNDGRPSFR